MAFHSDNYRTCGKAQPSLVGRAGIEPPPTAPKARPLKDWAIWTLVISHRYRWAMDILTVGGSGDPRRKLEEMGEQEREREC